MTVIATDGRSMAGDGRALAGWTIADDDRVKVHRLASGAIVGTCGKASQGQAFRDWLDGGPEPTDTADFGALVLNPDGSIDYYDGIVKVPMNTAPQAIGCGSDFALAAMDLGKTPTEAVAYAITRNAGCGGKITTIEVR